MANADDKDLPIDSDLQELSHIEAEKENPQGIACWLLTSDTKAVFVLRYDTDTDEAGKWGILTGGIHEGETADQSVEREYIEELNISDTSINFHRILGTQSYPYKGRPFRYQLFKGTLDITSKVLEDKFVPTEEVRGIKCIAIAEVPNFIADHTGNIAGDEIFMANSFNQLKEYLGEG